MKVIALLAVLAACHPLAAAPRSGPYDLQFKAAPETRDGRPLIVVRGTTNFPEKTLLRGDLAYQPEGAPPQDLYAPYRVEVQDGRFEIPLDARFRDDVFPGTYHVKVVFDTAVQDHLPPALLTKLKRRYQRPLTRTVTVVIGTPGKARILEKKLREEWKHAFQTLGVLGGELRRAFQQQRRQPFKAKAWDAWHQPWQKRFENVHHLKMGQGEYRILCLLNGSWISPGFRPVWTYRDELGHLLEKVASHADKALRAAPRNEDDLDRVEGWLRHFRKQHEHYAAILPLLHDEGTAGARQALGRLHEHLRALKIWLDQWKQKAAGHGPEDWAVWGDAWHTRFCQDLIRLGGGDHPDLPKALNDMAQQSLALKVAVAKAVGSSTGTGPLDAALDDFSRSLAALESLVPKDDKSNP
jgi:hypothetical protein